MGKKILVATGGGDCPGLNAVIRGIVKRADQEGDWKVYGCMESFNGILKDHMDHCIVDAVASGDRATLDELDKAIDLLMK